MGLCTGIVRDAWGRKRVGREFGTKNGGGELFFPLSNVRMSQQVGLKDWFPLKLSCISSVFRSGPGFFLGEHVFFLGIR